MIVLDKIKIVKIEEKNNYGKFEIGPLPKGFGHTIGNPIRRILLSSISGAAITSVKIDGVRHEYSTFEGVQDDVLSLMLNLKNVAVKSHAEGPVVLKLNMKGKKGEVVEVRVADFEENSEIEFANPELVLTEITKADAKLNLEITIEKGNGYALPNESKRAEIGVIPVDSLFSPVKHVSMDIATARVGQQTDLDQIVLEIHTTGAMTPTDALLESIEIFDALVNKLVDLAGGDSENNRFDIVTADESVEEDAKPILINELGLSTRLMNSLLNTGITDLRQLTGKSRNELLTFKGMGKKSFDELIDVLNKNDITVN